jgi:hypothetical protein
MNTHRTLLGKLEGKRPLGKARRSWVYNIKIQLIGWSGMNWINLAQDRDQWSIPGNMIMNLWDL